MLLNISKQIKIRKLSCFFKLGKDRGEGCGVREGSKVDKTGEFDQGM